MMTTAGFIEDEDAIAESLEMIEEDNPEVELDFSTEEHSEGGHIYESIEEEVGPAAAEAAIEDIPPDDGSIGDDTPGLDIDYEEELPESFYGS